MRQWTTCHRDGYHSLLVVRLKSCATDTFLALLLSIASIAGVYFDTDMQNSFWHYVIASSLVMFIKTINETTNYNDQEMDIFIQFENYILRQTLFQRQKVLYRHQKSSKISVYPFFLYLHQKIKALHIIFNKITFITMFFIFYFSNKSLKLESDTTNWTPHAWVHFHVFWFMSILTLGELSASNSGLYEKYKNKKGKEKINKNIVCFYFDSFWSL